MNIVIIGCGNTGSRLANDLDKLGYNVSVIDCDKDKAELLYDKFSGRYICGNATDVDVLKGAGCANADMTIVVTNSDNVNIMVARVLDFEFSVSNTYVRVSDPSREAVFRRLGLKTVSRTRIESDIFLSLATSSTGVIDPVKIGGSNVNFYTENAQKKHEDKTPDEIPCKDDEMLFAIRKTDGSLHFANEAHFYIEQGDTLIFATI